MRNFEYRQDLPRGLGEHLKDKKMAQVRIGIIGCGRISGSHIRGYKEHPGCRIVAVMDINEERAKEGAQLADTEKYYLDLRELLEKERPCGVSICTPPSTHALIATECLSRCVSVLCEKPFSTSPEEAKRMVVASKNSGAILQVAYKRRFYPDVREAKEMIEAGKIGKVLFFRNMFGGFKNMKERTWFADPEVAGGGASMDAGSHSVDLVRYFCGEAKRVSFLKANLVQDLQVDDTATLFLELESGCFATLAVTWSVPVPSTHYAEIYGSEGTILMGRDSRYKLSDEKEWKRIEGGPAQIGAQMGHFVECIENKATPIVTGIDGLRVQEIIHAAYKSHRSGKWEEVERTLS